MEHGEKLATLRALANDFVPPEGACTSWRALLLRCEQLEADLMAHVHLENHVLFPRARRKLSAPKDSCMRTFPLNPVHPERVCWGCDKFCPAQDLSCGNGSERTMHPCELFGSDWVDWAKNLGEISPNSPDSPKGH